MADLNALHLPADARVLFASDMHLGEHDPATAAWFLGALDAHMAQHSHLILLGDLFEAWIGDDQLDPVAMQLQHSLTRLHGKRPVYVMRGNRDFLLDVQAENGGHERFSKATGVTMLADPCLLQVGGESWLLAHGDALCTDDTDYQAFRKQSRQAAWQQAFLARPLTERVQIAADMRQQSELETARKPGNLTDVNDRAACELLRQTSTRRLIHGHTHRPGHHVYREAEGVWERWVLPDWEAAAQRGGFLALAAGTLAPLT